MKNRTPQIEQIAAAARRMPEDTRVPLAFEKRIMHAIRERRPMDAWSLWTQTMWRAAAACVAITVLAGALAQYNDEPEELLATDLEQTVMAAMKLDESW